MDETTMRVGVGQFRDPSREKLRFVRQLGVEDIVFNFAGRAADLPIEGTSSWDVQDLVQLRNRVEDAGLRIAAIENLPLDFYEDVMLGGEDRDEQLAGVKETIRNLGRADIPILGYNWMPNLVWSSSTSRRVRGGAEARAYDHDQLEDVPWTHDRAYTESEFWGNYEHFLREVLPVAEEAGVTMCVHPDDPPVPSLGGIPRLLRSVENMKRAMNLVDSPNHGVEFGLGVFSEMGADMRSIIEYFGERDEIIYVHFRDVEGTIPSFYETFIDEGNYDEWDVLCALDDVGFEGVMIPDHVPTMACDDPWASGTGYTVGYLKGMLNGLQRERTAQ